MFRILTKFVVWLVTRGREEDDDKRGKVSVLNEYCSCCLDIPCFLEQFSRQ